MSYCDLCYLIGGRYDGALFRATLVGADLLVVRAHRKTIPEDVVVSTAARARVTAFRPDTHGRPEPDSPGAYLRCKDGFFREAHLKEALRL